MFNRPSNNRLLYQIFLILAITTVDVSRHELQELDNEGKIMARISNKTRHNKVNFYTYRVDQKLVHLSYANWVPPKQFLPVSSENTDFPEKIV